MNFDPQLEFSILDETTAETCEKVINTSLLNDILKTEKIDYFLLRAYFQLQVYLYIYIYILGY